MNLKLYPIITNGRRIEYSHLLFNVSYVEASIKYGKNFYTAENDTNLKLRLMSSNIVRESVSALIIENSIEIINK
jgi:hypothetical protein